jgi:dTDP-4-amino-4,6-dideoxygalactose transaminase
MRDSSPAIRNIAQADPKAAYLATKGKIDRAICRVLASGSYILGPEVEAFETEFARWLGAPSAIGCANGTDALVLALRGIGIGVGHAVATVSHTAVATIAAIEMVGAIPVLLDIDPETFTLDPTELDAILSKGAVGGVAIKAVIVVHLYGQPADLKEICSIADRYGIIVIEDCAQAHGAVFDSRAAGLWGTASAFSFYPTKNLGAIGDGGAVVTSDLSLASRVRSMRQYGWDGQRVCREPGLNSRLDELQAAILRVKLDTLTADNARRVAIAAIYDRDLSRAGTTIPTRKSDRSHVFHQYVIRRRNRDLVRERLHEAGVDTAVHYPLPVHLQPGYRGRIALGPAQCRVTEHISTEIISLPIHPHLADDEAKYICNVINTLPQA